LLISAALKPTILKLLQLLKFTHHSHYKYTYRSHNVLNTYSSLLHMPAKHQTTRLVVLKEK